MPLQKSDVTIIIPSMLSDRNQYALDQCLNSLRESDFPMENVTVAFNNLHEYPVRGLYTYVEDVEWMGIYEQGQCVATNRAADKSDTKWIMVSNDDMIYPPFWFEKLTAHLSHSEGCVSPQLIEPIDGAPTFKKVFCGGVGGDWDKEKFMKYAQEHIKDEAVLRPGFNLPFLIKKELWDLVGGYDEAYDPWGSNSDSDLEYKIRLAGVQPMQDTGCPVYHFSQTSGTFHPDNRDYWQKNWDYFIEKWGFERAGSPEIWEATFEIPYEKLKYKPDWAVIPEEEQS